MKRKDDRKKEWKAERRKAGTEGHEEGKLRNKGCKKERILEYKNRNTEICEGIKRNES